MSKSVYDQKLIRDIPKFKPSLTKDSEIRKKSETSTLIRQTKSFPLKLSDNLSRIEVKLMMTDLKRTSAKIATVAVISAIYASLTIASGPLAYSWLQLRVSEALAPLPFLLGLQSVAGLAIGCILANVFSPVGLPDAIFGPLLTLLAALLSWKLSFNNRLLACVYPVIVNAFGVSTYLASFYGVDYWLSVAAIAVGESIASVLIGYPLLRAVEKALPREDVQKSV